MQLYFVNTVNINMKNIKLYEYHYSVFLMYIFTTLTPSRNSGYTVPQTIIFHSNHPKKMKYITNISDDADFRWWNFEKVLPTFRGTSYFHLHGRRVNQSRKMVEGKTEARAVWELRIGGP
jgi:hypothetical protein